MEFLQDAYVALMTVRVLFLSFSVRPTITGIPCVCIRVHLIPPFQMDPNSSLQLNGSLCVCLSVYLLLSRFRALALSRALFISSRALSPSHPLSLSLHTLMYTLIPTNTIKQKCPSWYKAHAAQRPSLSRLAKQPRSTKASGTRLPRRSGLKGVRSSTAESTAPTCLLQTSTYGGILDGGEGTSSLMTHPLRCFVTAWTLIGCADPLGR